MLHPVVGDRSRASGVPARLSANGGNRDGRWSRGCARSPRWGAMAHAACAVSGGAVSATAAATAWRPTRMARRSRRAGEPSRELEGGVVVHGAEAALDLCRAGASVVGAEEPGERE